MARSFVVWIKTEDLIVSDKIKKGDNSHPLFYNDVIPIALIPFGEISTDDEKISWPPDHDTILNVIGFEEAFQNSLTIRLREKPLLEIQVVDLPSLAMLKIISFSDWNTICEGRDAIDLAHIFDNYLDAGNIDRLYEEYGDIIEESEFNYDIAPGCLEEIYQK